MKAAGILSLSVFIILMAFSPGINAGYQAIHATHKCCHTMAASKTNSTACDTGPCKMACCNAFGGCCITCYCFGVIQLNKGFLATIPQGKHLLYTYDSKLDNGVPETQWQPPEFV